MTDSLKVLYSGNRNAERDRINHVIQSLKAIVDALSVSGAPANADYLTVAHNAGLANSRYLVAGSNISIVDGGAGSTLTISSTASGGSSITEGAYSSLPGSPSNGDVYLVTDAPAIEHRSGGAWKTFGPAWNLTPAVSGDFSWDNQGGATDSAFGPYRHLDAPASASSNMRVRYKTIGGGLTTLDVLLAGQPVLGSFVTEYGVGWRQSGTGEYAMALFTNNAGTEYLYSSYRASATTAGTTDYTSMSWNHNFPTWVRLVDDGVNRKIYLSTDGFYWQLFHSIARTTDMTPDQWFYYANSKDASHTAGISILSWKES